MQCNHVDALSAGLAAIRLRQEANGEGAATPAISPSRVGGYGQLPAEVRRKVLGHLQVEDLEVARCVNRDWNADALCSALPLLAKHVVYDARRESLGLPAERAASQVQAAFERHFRGVSEDRAVQDALCMVTFVCEARERAHVPDVLGLHWPHFVDALRLAIKQRVPAFGPWEAKLASDAAKTMGHCFGDVRLQVERHRRVHGTMPPQLSKAVSNSGYLMLMGLLAFSSLGTARATAWLTEDRLDLFPFSSPHLELLSRTYCQVLPRRLNRGGDLHRVLRDDEQLLREVFAPASARGVSPEALRRRQEP